LGVEVIELPLSVFDLDLPNYEAYDQDKVPFMVDVKAFFRIMDSRIASERVENMHELNEQLLAIVQGTIRKVLAMHDVEKIMVDRATFGELFTEETTESLAAWGVENVKNIELMDVRDAKGSETISNIMAKRESFIEKESRIEVAENRKAAAQKEIEAQREVDISEQEAEQKVGERTAEKTKMVGIAEEMAQQEIKEQARVTAEKDMAVKKVNDVRTAEINREVRVVQADEAKQVDIVESEGKKQEAIIVAEGMKESEFLRAMGIEKVGNAEAEAIKAKGLAEVAPDIRLAEEIGENEGYQEYLVKIRVQDKEQAVGEEAARALQTGDLKIIANAGDVNGGMNSLLDIFSSKGGTNLGAALEGLAQTEVGGALLNKVTGTKD
jgi:flotillin